MLMTLQNATTAHCCVGGVGDWIREMGYSSTSSMLLEKKILVKLEARGSRQSTCALAYINGPHPAQIANFDFSMTEHDEHIKKLFNVFRLRDDDAGPNNDPHFFPQICPPQY